MSPSELPDSPTETMPQSPRRSITNIVTSSPHIQQVTRNSPNRQENLPTKKFDDDRLHAYIVENTPCNFSSATSLSNLSIEEDDDDLKINDTVSDQLLFDACINIGINSVTKPKPLEKSKEKVIEKILSDDESSDDGSDTGNDQLLEQCIRDGMQKSKSKDELINLTKENPIGMMRNRSIHSKFTGNDEINKFQVEDSPCNFSNISVLSSLTIDSAVANNQRFVAFFFFLLFFRIVIC